MYGMAKPLADSIGATVVKVGTTTTTTTTEMVCLYGFERKFDPKDVLAERGSSELYILIKLLFIVV
ncbi:hypothetical protein HUJ04_013589 [Dendroctonus ponderosae]|nr:hypothetical protein HUJ04_013589 [Dendroctonus ponderosae]